MLQSKSIGRRPRDDGISEVVGFVIILAVVMAGLSLYLTYAVPVQGREEEIRVMDGVRAWFVDYKTGVDQLWLNSPMMPDPGDPLLFNATIQQVTLRKVIDTGTTREKGLVGRFMPVLAPIPASAAVSVKNTENFTVTAWRNDADDLQLDEHNPHAPVYLVQLLLAPAGVLLPGSAASFSVNGTRGAGPRRRMSR